MSDSTQVATTTSFKQKEATELSRIEPEGNTLVDEFLDAAADGDIEKIKGAIAAGVDVNSIDEAGWTALHLSAYFGFAEIVETLIAHGANVDQQSNDGSTPLILAAAMGTLEPVNILLESKANPDAANKGGFTALMGACDRQVSSLIDTLLDYKANPLLKNPSGETCCYLLIQKIMREKQKLGLDYKFSNAHLSSVRRLMIAGAEAGAKHESAPLAQALEHTGNEELIQILDEKYGSIG